MYEIVKDKNASIKMKAKIAVKKYLFINVLGKKIKR